MKSPISLEEATLRIGSAVISTFRATMEAMRAWRLDGDTEKAL